MSEVPADWHYWARPGQLRLFEYAVMAEIDDLFIAVTQARSLLEAGSRDPSLDAAATMATHRGHEALTALWRGLLDPGLPFIDAENDEAWRQLTWRIGEIGERTGAATLAWECQTRLRELRGRPSPTLRQEELHARSQLDSRLGDSTQSGEGAPGPGSLRRSASSAVARLLDLSSLALPFNLRTQVALASELASFVERAIERRPELDASSGARAPGDAGRARFENAESTVSERLHRVEPPDSDAS